MTYLEITFRLTTILLAAISLAGCATRADRVLEVTRRQSLANIRPEDERMFTRDRATHFRTEVVARPSDKQSDEYFVRWRSPSAQTIKFEYRLLNQPNEVREQRFSPSGKRHHTFSVRGQERLTGGGVTAWRVSLWSDAAAPLAEQRSALW